MQSPINTSNTLEAPRTVERRRRGRGLDVMSTLPTPEQPRHHAHLPTPVTERRPGKHMEASETTMHVGLPTPQTLPRKRASFSPAPGDDSDSSAHPSPSGHTTFFLSSTATAGPDKITPRRRPGLMFAQQMGLVATEAATSGTVKFGGRLGVGVGMGGGHRSTSHGSADKVPMDNPFLDASSFSGRSTAMEVEAEFSATPKGLESPGTETRYIPQALRASAERSLSPHPLRTPRHVNAATPVGAPLLSTNNSAGPSSEAALRASRKRMMNEDDNPFIARAGEVVRAQPTSEDRPLVTYVFRGAKKVFANPFVPPSTAFPPANLDPAHPEYDVHPCPPPRLLWPSKEAAPTTPQPPRSGPSRRFSGHQSMDLDIDPGPLTDTEDFEPEDEDSDDSLPVRRGLLFGGAKHERSPDATLVSRKRSRPSNVE